jgi:drug/metabolite transporter (DMT)-like permease
MKFVLAGLIAVLGVAAFLYGGADDSPGAQLIGVVLVLGAAAFSVREARRTR